MAKPKRKEMMQVRVGPVSLQLPMDTEYIDLVKKLLSTFQKAIELEEEKKK